MIRRVYDRWLAPLVADQVSLMLIRWREKGNFLNDEQKAKLARPSDTEEDGTVTMRVRPVTSEEWGPSDGGRG